MSVFYISMEFEHAENGSFYKKNDVARISINMVDGRRYELNVYTFKFLKTAIKNNKKRRKYLNGLYLLPPDLFVKKLTRPIIEATIHELLRHEDLEYIFHQRVWKQA